MIDGKTSTNTTLKISLATQTNDTAVVALHKGTDSLCGCYNFIARCSTKEDRSTGQRPYCEFELDWCKLAKTGAGEYYLSVIPEVSPDIYNPIPYTIFAGVQNAAPNLVTLTPSSGCGAQSKSTFSLPSRSTQHFRVTPTRTLTEAEVIEVYITNVQNGVLEILGNSGGFATSQCRFAEPVRCAPNGDKNCILRLTCAKQIDYIAVKVEGTKGNVPVDFTIGSCITAFTSLALATPSRSTELVSGASESFLVRLNTLVAAQVPTVAIRVVPTKNDVPFTVTFTQGRCSACSDFAREIKCPGGPCLLATHFWQLPSNWATTNFYVQVTNNDPAQSVNFVATVTPSPISTAKQSSVTTGSVETISATAGTWSVVEWVVTSTEASRSVGVASGRVALAVASPAPVPASSQVHRVQFFVLDKAVTPTVNPTLFPAAGGAGTTDRGLYDISSCCLTPGKWLIYIWNGSPTTGWSLSTTPAINYVTRHVSGAMNTPIRLDVAIGDSIANAFVNFPGFPLGTTDPGTSLRVSARPTDSASSAVNIFWNVNRPAGPNQASGCTTNQGSTTNPAWYRSFYSCAAAPLDPAVYWIGVNSPTATRTYEVTVREVLPSIVSIRAASDNTWSPDLQTPIDVWHQTKFDLLDSHRSYGVRLTAQVEITAGTGTVELHWNSGAPAGPNSASNPCLGSLGKTTVTRTDTGSTGGTLDLPTCLEGIKTIYLGTTVTSGAPTYRVRITSLNLFPGDQTRVLTLEMPTAAVNDASVTKQHLLNFLLPSATPVPTNYLRFTLNGIKWTGTPGTVSVVSGQAGSCAFGNEVTCNKAGDSCFTIVYPCQINSLTQFNFHVTLSQPGSYNALIQLQGTEQPVSEIQVGEERQVFLKQNDLRFFRLNLRTGVRNLAPSDSLAIQVTSVSCGTAVAWINRGNGASPTCNLNSVGGKTCNGADCTLFQLSACDLMDLDLGGLYYVTVRGLEQSDPTGEIKFRLKVAVIKGAISAGTKVITFLETEEHRLLARPYDLLKANPITGALPARQCTPPVLPQFADCCGAKPENITTTWVTDDIYYEYVIPGGHHLGYGTRIEVGVTRDVASAGVHFTTDYPYFCGPKRYARSYACTVTPSQPCIFDVDSCVQSTRQVWVWVNPDSVKWTSGNRGPTVASGESYEVAWVRPTTKQFALFEITPIENGTMYTQYHPFWLLPGELEYIQIAHPSNYDTVPNYHVYISAEKVFGGSIELVQEKSWVPCVAGECTIRECHTVLDQDECTQKAGACRCENSNRIYIPSCFDEKSNERFDDDNADHIVLRALGTGTTPITGRLKITFWEKEEPFVADRCETVVTGKSRFFLANVTLDANQIWKFTVTDMQQDAGAVRLSLNDGKIALPRVPCAEKAFCTANGNSCSLFFRGEQRFLPRVSVYGENTGILPGNHNFNIKYEIITPDVVVMTAGVTYISPTLKIDRNSSCAAAVAPQYYRYTTRGTADYISVVVVSPHARAWINRGHITHGWGKWTCDGRATGGVCETIIYCDYVKSVQNFYIHVEGSSHEITIYEGTLAVTDAKFQTGLTTPTLSLANPVFAFRLTQLTAPTTNDPTRDLAVTLSGKVHKTWLSYDKAGDPSCRIPQTAITNAPTSVGSYVTIIPSCHLPVNLNKTIFVNVAPRLPRTGEASCPDSVFSISSNFVSNNIGITASNTFTGFEVNRTYVVAPTINGLKSQHFIDIGSLGSDEVIVTRVSNTNMPLRHTVWKTNYDVAPRK